MSASAKKVVPEMDEAMQGAMEFPGSIAGTMDISMIDSDAALFCRTTINGATGRLVAEQPFIPHMGRGSLSRKAIISTAKN